MNYSRYMKAQKKIRPITEITKTYELFLISNQPYDLPLP